MQAEISRGSVIAFALSLVLIAIPEARATESPLSLKVDLPKTTYRTGEPIDVELTLKNVSRSDVVVLVSRIEWDFPIIVRDSRGKELRLTRYGERLEVTRGASAQRFVHETLKPGESLDGRLRVNLLYDMTLEGEYRIGVTYQAVAPKNVGPGAEHFDDAIAPDVGIRIELPTERAELSPATRPAGG